MHIPAYIMESKYGFSHLPCSLALVSVVRKCLHIEAEDKLGDLGPMQMMSLNFRMPSESRWLPEESVLCLDYKTTSHLKRTLR